MATNLSATPAARRESDAQTYVELLGELDAALTQERQAHRRLMGLARRIQRRDERRLPVN